MTGDAAFPEHVFDALGVEPLVWPEKIGGSVLVVERHPADGPITMMTSGVSKIPVDAGEPIELAVEVLEGQQGAARVALGIVCDGIATTRRLPPVGSPWRNATPFLNGTSISAILVTPSRWGSSFDDVRAEDGAVVGHVRTLRLLTDDEAARAQDDGWEALVEEAGSVDVFLDVTREATEPAVGAPGNTPVFLSKLHEDHPPRWITFTGSDLRSVTGLESEDYMADASNHEVWSVGGFLTRFPWTRGFVERARPGQTALFTDDSGDYTLEDD